MSVPLAAMDYIVSFSPPPTCEAAQDNPYVLVLTAGGQALLRLPARVLATGAEGHNTLTTVDSACKTVHKHKSMELLVELRGRFPDTEEGLQQALDTLKVILYGPNLTAVTTRDAVSRREVVTFTPRLREIQTDQHGALSFSNAYSNQKMCVQIMDYFQRSNLGLAGLSITDATAACGGDSMQFILTKKTKNGTEPLFTKVTSVEINKERCDMLRNNMAVVRAAFPTPVRSSVICANYGTLLGMLPSPQAQNTSYVTQDIVYIDPQWGGKSQEQSRSALTLYSVTKDPKLIKEFDGEDLIINYELVVHHLVERIMD